jgi:hypothetical protein
MVRPRTEGKNCLPNGASIALSYLRGYKRDPYAHGAIHQASIEHPKTPRLRKHTSDSLCSRFEHLLSCELATLCLCACFLTCVRCVAATLALACVSIASLTLAVLL